MSNCGLRILGFLCITLAFYESILSMVIPVKLLHNQTTQQILDNQTYVLGQLDSLGLDAILAQRIKSLSPCKKGSISYNEKQKLIAYSERMPSLLLHQRFFAGYPVCTTIGQPSSTIIDVCDRKSPHMGVIVKMTHTGSKRNCSLSVSVICNSNGVEGPQTLETVGFCDYNTELKHPLGCAKIISSHGNGLGWFGTFMLIILCLFGAYLLAGAVYRYFFLHIRGIDVSRSSTPFV
ncbi:UNVERIFIED_CONTAM: hypothetical protein Sangu_2962800 [Sesamum angustifolium]|uniref:Uncharacterized protein n=1 Tax=Sesamum angustifolium TaxID=2727405 RepID=A0AAW2IL60_9LAMI